MAAYIAERFEKMRELEGALIRVLAYESLLGRRLSIELAREVLDKNLHPN